MTVVFEGDEVERFARFVAELIRQHLSFRVTRGDGGSYLVALTGGY